MKIEITWSRPDGSKPTVGFEVQPTDPNSDDEQMQIRKSIAAAQAHFNQKFGTPPPLKELSVKTFSVSFNSLPLTDPRFHPDMAKSFIKVGQLFGWELPQKDHSYTGLLVIGEKTVPQGFQTMADCTLDIPTTPIPMEKAKRIVDTVQREFQERGVLSITTPAQA